MALSAVPKRMVQKRAKGLEDGKRYARASLWCAGAYWVVYSIATIIHLAGWDEPRSQRPAPGEMLLWLVWSIVCGLGGIAGLVGLFAAVTALIKGGLQRITVVALLVNAPLVITLVVSVIMRVLGAL